ncbi:MAG: hypothetical protein JXA78_06245 [Anaerolineales bacterium]|nr:hypothetical protein [Anaerolineales bacterium]
MSARTYLLFWLFGLGVLLAVAAFQSAPGYMDADYYYAGGLRLAGGHGFSELVLWNYLDDPAGLPHPSHAYWMPLVSILAALGMRMLGSAQYAAARLGFWPVAAAVPPLTAALSFSITGRRPLALLAGLLALFSGFYLPYLPTTDAFGPYMLLGALFLLSIRQPASIVSPPRRALMASFFWLGLCAGLMHLARADGALWLVVAIALAGVCVFERDSSLQGLPNLARRLVSCLAGYLLVMGSWLLRNLSEFGAPLSPGGSRAFWVTNYDELFIYPASLLTPERWLSTGIGEIVKARLWAGGLNLQTALAVQGEIFLLPLIVIGLWQLRADRRVRTGAFAWFLTFIAMTLVFPYQGARGGFFHSGAAVQPLFWAVAPLGLETLIAWLGRLRSWNIDQAQGVFRAGLVVLTLFLTALVSYSRVFGDDFARPAWNESSAHYARLEQALVDLGASPGEVVLVNNSPGYFAASGRPAISIPDGDVNTLLDVAERYQGHYLLLEFNQLQGQDDLYARPDDLRPGLRYLATFEETRIFQITSDAP